MPSKSKQKTPCGDQTDSCNKATRDLFRFCFWLARTYATSKPEDSLEWENAKVPPSTAQIVKSTRAQVQQFKTQLEAAQQEIASRPAPDEDELARLHAELSPVIRIRKPTACD